MKQIQKYVAFNPSSSEATEWWTADSLEGIADQLWSAQATIGEPTVGRITKDWEGRYHIEDIEIYNVKIHPDVVEALA